MRILLLLVTVAFATEYQLPDEETVSAHFQKMKQLRAELKLNQKSCMSYGNPNDLPVAPIINPSPTTRSTTIDTVSIPINYHVIYVGGDSVYMNLQVDNAPYEHCMWDIWSYDNNTFLLYPGFGFDYPGHSYSLGGVLTPGSYALFIYDDFGYGGVGGTVTTSDGTVLATLNQGSYSYYTFLQFTAPDGPFIDGIVSNTQIENQTAVLNQKFNQHGYSFYTANIDSANNSGWYYATDSHKFETGQWNNDDQYLAMAQAMGIDPATSINYYWTGARFTSGLGVYPWSFDEDDPRHGLFCGNYTRPGGETGFHLGITGVHEVGHYFGLYHTFENGCANPGDEVDDTPYQMDANYGCPSSNYSCGSNDDIGNFMDYMDDDCLDHFTTGQVDRMDWALNTYRPLLIGGGSNEPPTAVSLISPSDSSSLSVTNNNIGDNIGFVWTSSTDPDGDDLTYSLSITSEVLGDHDFETTDNFYSLGNSWIVEKLGLASQSEGEIEWNISVSDGDDGVVSSNGPFHFSVEAYDVLSNEIDQVIPKRFAIDQIFPNPFNPITTIRFTVEKRHASLLNIYDISGRVVDVLVEGHIEAGQHEIQWNASQHASGIYFVELMAGKDRDIQKLILLK